jgi:hypothetical protein
MSKQNSTLLSPCPLDKTPSQPQPQATRQHLHKNVFRNLFDLHQISEDSDFYLNLYYFLTEVQTKTPITGTVISVALKLLHDFLGKEGSVKKWKNFTSFQYLFMTCCIISQKFHDDYNWEIRDYTMALSKSYTLKVGLLSMCELRILELLDWRIFYPTRVLMDFFASINLCDGV